MEEGKRQKQIAGLLHEEMSTIFQRMGLNMIDGGMVSISSVKVTPDLLEARFYLSLFQVKDVEAALKKIDDRHHDIEKELRYLFTNMTKVEGGFIEPKITPTPQCVGPQIIHVRSG